MAMVKMPLRTMAPPGVIIQTPQDMVPAYTQNGPTCRTSFIRWAIGKAYTKGGRTLPFNLGHRQSAPEGYKWGLVRGITSALASLPDSLKEKLLLDAQRRGKLEDLCNSVREIPPEAALRMFHESIIQDNAPLVESRLQTIPNDLLLLLRECPDVQVPEELTRAS